MKKLINFALIVALVGSLAGCGTKETVETKQPEVGSSPESNLIKVAASSTPHAEILEAAKPLLEEKGYELEVKVFSDYILPNKVVDSGEFDANYFQHVPYLESFNEENKTNLVVAGKIHYEPFGIYPGKKSDLSDLKKGDVIAIPNDTSNEARALKLLEEKSIIKLADNVGFDATIKDIKENPYGIKFKEIEAAQIPRIRDEVALSIINGNYALAAGLSVTNDSLYYESVESEAAITYVNVIAVDAGNENSEKIKALVDVLKSNEIKEFIDEKYNGSVLVFEE